MPSPAPEVSPPSVPDVHVPLIQSPMQNPAEQSPQQPQQAPVIVKKGGFVAGMLVGAALLIGALIVIGINQKPDYQQSNDAARAAQDSAAQASAAAADAAEAATAVAEASTDTAQESPIEPANSEAMSEPQPDSGQAIPAPQLREGMRWNIKTTDFKDPKSSYDNVQYMINHADSTGYTSQKEVIGRPNSKVDLSYDDSLNLIGGKTGQYSPALHYYDFPLQTGKTWNVESTVSGNTFKDRQIAKGEVLGWDTVSSAFGEVQALKILVEFTSYKEGQEVSKGMDMSWYLPEIGRAVKSEEYYWDAEQKSWVKGREHEVFNFYNP